MAASSNQSQVAVLPGADKFSKQIEHVYKQAERDPAGSPVLKIGMVLLSIAFAFGVSTLDHPPPKICGTLHGPSVTAPRIRLPDGRPVAYTEAGVSKLNAKHRVVVIHDYGRSRLDLFPCSQETLQKLGVYLVSFDRAGYGESHPFPHRSIASEARDIEQFADNLDLGPKFHIIAVGIGAYAAWSCVKDIPHRLAGVAIVAPVANFWWPGLPAAAANEAFQNLPPGDRYILQVAHYLPQLLYWWSNQRWFPSSNMASLNQVNEITEVAIQQSVQESIHKDLVIQFSNWDLDLPVEKNPLGTCSAHVWQKDGDPYFPSAFQQWLKGRLPWFQYHTIAVESTSLLDNPGLGEEIISSLVAANETCS